MSSNQMLLGNMLHRDNTLPISLEHPLYTYDTQLEAVKNAIVKELENLAFESGNETDEVLSTLENILQILDSLNSKDFSTETKLEEIRSVLVNVEDVLDSIDAKDFGTEAKLEVLRSTLTQTNNLLIEVKEKLPNPPIWGADLASRPNADSVPIGQAFVSIYDNFQVSVSNGQDWVVM